MVEPDGALGRILLAEDDREVRDALVRVLEFERYDVEAVTNGAEVFEAFDRRAPDVLVLDVMMPIVDGLTVCRRLRARGDVTPVLILTARQEVSDRVAGLDAGADDYLPKPFAVDELLARLRALLRRIDPIDPAVLRVDDLTLDATQRLVHRGARALDLTKTEFEILELLMRNERVVLERAVIYERIWGFDFDGSSKSLDVHVGYLRRKLEAGGEPRLVHTVRGVGYVLRAEPS